MIRMSNAIFGLILLFIILIFSGCATAPGEDKTEPQVFGHTNRIAVIGDSISYGINPNYSYSNPYGWVHILSNSRNSIWADTMGIIGNFAESGDTAAQWNSTNKIQPVINFNPDIVIVFIGANDILGYIGDGNVSESEKTQLSNNFCGILDKVTNGLSQVKLVVVGYYDLFDGYSSLLAGISYYSNMSEYTLEGNTLLASVGSNYGASYVNIYTSFMNHCYGQSIGGSGHLTPDYVRLPITSFNIHPVTAGHQKICDNIKAVLQTITN